MRRVSNACLVACFVVAIFLPLGINVAGIDGADPEAENRTPAEWPTADGSLASIGRFGSNVGLWFDDHFGLRSHLIRWYGVTRYFWMGVTPAPTVAIGNDGWLFYVEDGGLEDWTHERPMEPSELASWRDMIARASAWCRARGITYLFAVAPDKYTIYPEKFPDTVRQLTPVSRADQVIGATAHLGVVIDLRQRLLQQRDTERLFHKTDTHWNPRGAFLAYQQIMDTLHARDPRVEPPKSRGEFEDAVRTIPGMDLASMIGLKRLLTEEDLRFTPKTPRKHVVRVPAGGYATGGDPLIITEIPGSTLPRAVVFRDSFASSLAPLLSEHFSRVVYLWQNNFDATAIEQERPDVVLQEIVGRHLYNVYASPELVPDP